MIWAAAGAALLVSLATAAPPPEEFSGRFSVYVATGHSAIVGDAFWEGRLGVGTRAHAGRAIVKASSSSAVAFQVSGVDQMPFLAVSTSGAAGVGVRPSTGLDVMGWIWGDDSDTGQTNASIDPAVLLLNGNRAGTLDRYQLGFSGFGGVGFRHGIRTRHAAGKTGNTFDFLLWPSESRDARALPSLLAASVQSHHRGTALHIMPSGYADANVVVSDGKRIGTGAVHRRRELAFADNAFITNVTPLDESAERQSSLELLQVKHGKRASSQGILTEWSSHPPRVRRPNGAVSIDERITQMELVGKDIIRRLESLEADSTDPGGRR